MNTSRHDRPRQAHRPPAGGEPVVQVDTPEACRILGDPDQNDRNRQRCGHRDSLVAGLDVHQHEGVAQRNAPRGAAGRPTPRRR